LTKNEFETLFRYNPETMLIALHAIKHITSEYSAQSTTAEEKLRCDSIFFHVLKTHGVTKLLFKANQKD
jgi:hypothetical protein